MLRHQGVAFLTVTRIASGPASRTRTGSPQLPPSRPPWPALTTRALRRPSRIAAAHRRASSTPRRPLALASPHAWSATRRRAHTHEHLRPPWPCRYFGLAVAVSRRPCHARRQPSGATASARSSTEHQSTHAGASSCLRHTHGFTVLPHRPLHQPCCPEPWPLHGQAPPARSRCSRTSHGGRTHEAMRDGHARCSELHRSTPSVLLHSD